MALKDSYIQLLKRLPTVARPIQRLTFKEKLKWTLLMLVAYTFMAQIQVYGIGDTSAEFLRSAEILLGSSIGSLMTLGIGPIVTASIILQLMVGSKLINWDLTKEQDKIMFQGTQKLLAVAFSFIEAIAFTAAGVITPASPELAWLVMVQLALGGIIVILMDELISKWGFGSGIGLFIVAGVSKTIFVGALNPLTTSGTLPNAAEQPVGVIPQFVVQLAGAQPVQALLVLIPLIATMLVFFLVVYISNMKVEVPLAFGSIRGFGRRWPLKFLYTSNIPVILISALIINLGIMGNIMAQQGFSLFGTYDAATGQSTGLLFFMTPPANSTSIPGLTISIGIFFLLGIIASSILRRPTAPVAAIFSLLGVLFWFSVAWVTGLTHLTLIPPIEIARALTYIIFMVAGSMVFAYFWMTTAGMDAKHVANQIHSVGMQIPGYRRDIRIIEMVLQRYIPGLTILGGAAVGFLAAAADFTNAIGTGTGILLASTIVYQLYEELAAKHMEDMHPALRKFMENR
ncbi:MAG: preprotein translocase subunit SecY [Candidatus Aenigmarchaeota archaeon]|nr:preprotein translocase subunit SecY [Candidatus Aenigmarchaeota archaeon]